MRQLLRRLWRALRQRQFDTDLREELEFHRASIERELQQNGVDPSEARFAARRAIGSVALAQDQARDVWTPRWLQGTGQDIRLGFRTLRATPVVTAVAVLSLALGIGANTAIFSLVNSLLLKSLPVHDPQHLVALGDVASPDDASVSYAVWHEIRDRHLLDQGFAWAVDDVTATDDEGVTRRLLAMWVSGGFFDVLGLPTIAGRTFTSAEDSRGGGRGGPVVVISYGLSQQRFGSASDAIGKTLTLSRLPFTIVGVTSPGFSGLVVGATLDVILPLESEPVFRHLPPRVDTRLWPWIQIMARVPPNSSVDAITAVVRRAQPQIRAATMPAYDRAADRDAYLRESWVMRSAAGGNPRLRERYLPALLALLVVVGLVAMVACANIANLQLARMSARRHEFSVRVALGASRLRLARQLLTESLLLSAVGAALGFAFAQWGSRVLVGQLATWAATPVLDLTPDWRVLGVTAAVTVLTALLFGAVPAFRAARVQPIDALKRQPRSLAGNSKTRPAGLLVIAQVALSLLLVVAAGLFLRSFAALAYRDLGFDRSRLLVAVVDAKYSVTPAENRATMYDHLREAAEAVPGVERAGISMSTPLGAAGVRFAPDIALPGSDGVVGSGLRTLTTPVSPGWFATYGMHLVAGRDFTSSDRRGAPAVVIANEAFAQRYLAGASPIGRTVLETTTPTDVQRLEIIGIVRNAAFTSARDPVEPMLYTPIAQGLDPRWLMSAPTICISVRAAAGTTPAGLTHALAETLTAVDPGVSVSFLTMTEQLNAYYVRERLLATVSGFFGVIALLLAALGLYAVTAYSVRRRWKEIGIRVALGAAPSGVVRLIVSQVLLLAGAGVTVGIATSLWASRFVMPLLYGLEPRDPVTLVGAAVMLATVAALAACLPAWRASRIDPAVVLRNE